LTANAVARSFTRGAPFAAIWIATALLFAISPLIASGSLSSSALTGMLPFAGVLAIAAMGQTLVIQQGGLDLSVPGTFSLGVVLVVLVPEGQDSQLALGLLVVLGVGMLAGFLNGIAVTRLGITSLVATLGMNAVLIGTVLELTGGKITFNSTPSWIDFTVSKVFGIPTIAVIAAIAIVLVAIFMRHSVWGRRFELVGASPTTARAAGLAVERYQLASYVAAGACYALAGALLAGLLNSPTLLAGDEYLLPTIAAVVLGGTALGGGRGSVIATAAGVLFLSQLDQVVTALGAKTSVQLVIQGVIVALGMGIRNIPWRRVFGRDGDAVDTPDSSARADNAGVPAGEGSAAQAAGTTPPAAPTSQQGGRS
jgi:ribose transport system permease protein